MKNYIVALLLTILIHLLLFISIKLEEPKINSPQKSNPSNIKYVRLLQPQPQIIEQKPAIKAPEKPIKKENKPIKKPKPKEYKKVSKELKKVPKRTIEQKQLPTKEIEKKPQTTQPAQPPVSPLESLLSYEKPKPKDRLTQSYLDLYGKEYDTFSKEQKKYLDNNLRNIGMITQKYLRYPQIAIRTHQQGTNVVEFFLHPNGDISDLKLITPTYYGALDENSIHTIEIAYKDYPRPQEKTKIRIYVSYYLR